MTRPWHRGPAPNLGRAGRGRVRECGVSTRGLGCCLHPPLIGSHTMWISSGSDHSGPAPTFHPRRSADAQARTDFTELVKSVREDDLLDRKVGRRRTRPSGTRVEHLSVGDLASLRSPARSHRFTSPSAQPRRSSTRWAALQCSRSWASSVAWACGFRVRPCSSASVLLLQEWIPWFSVPRCLGSNFHTLLRARNRPLPAVTPICRALLVGADAVAGEGLSLSGLAVAQADSVVIG